MSDKEKELASTTKQVIEEFTEQGFMFTALDASNEVKAVVSGVRHREVAPLVRDAFDKGRMGSDYTRTTIKVVAGSKTVDAFLYHDKTDDPEDYTGSQREQQASTPSKRTAQRGATATATAAGAPAAPLATEMNLTIEPDGRAAVPRAFLARAGVTDSTIYLDSARFGSGLVLGPVDPGVDPLAELSWENDAVYIPKSLLAAFDRAAPLVARLGPRCVEVEGRVR
jgi:hypothetical protein